LRSHQSSERIERVSLVPNDELQAVIEARRELGSEMEPEVIDAFVERVERRLDERVEERERSLKRKREHQEEVLAVCAAVAVIAIASAR
jgi:hypothetical protein